MRLDEVLGSEAGVGDKLYAPAPGEGWAALERRSRGVRLEVRFDPNVLPWLGAVALLRWLARRRGEARLLRGA